MLKGLVEGHVLTFRGLCGRHAVLHIIWLGLWLTPCLAWARADVATAVFDLPAQPLEQALERFSVLSGWSVIYRGTLAQGRTSHAVHGAMPPAQALESMLQGTGLAADPAGDGRVVVREAEPASATMLASPGDALDAAAVRREFGLLQRQLRHAFCDDPLLAPGNYSAQISFRVNGNGRVQPPELVAGSGDALRDRALLAAVGTLQLPASTAALPQPVTLDIRKVPANHDCGRRPSP